MKIHKNDQVLVISGKDRAKTGKILRVLTSENTVLIEGINLKKKHLKPKRSGEKGQIVQVPAPLHASNVKLICPKCAKAVKSGYKIEKGKKYRFCKKCGQEI
ncbi:50S ribosomal protein L24 [Patescibacteria group bacterium]|nr:50S ribosomal protein L24 [Patescibacteria group bacterium]